MKRVALLTFHDSDNFGSVLQAYATCRMLSQSGFECEILDLRKPEVEQIYRIFQPMNSKNRIANNVYNLMHYRQLCSRKKKFENFRQEKMKLSNRQFSKGEDIIAASLDYDAYVVGSDQVWNMDIIDFDIAYMLPFSDQSIRVAYAASFGPGKKDIARVKEYKKYLEKFNLVTVREKVAVETLSGVLEFEPEVVLDPVFFLNKGKWNELACNRIINEEYMFCYFAGGVTPEFEAFTKDYARKKGLKRVLLIPEWKNIFRRGKRCYDTSPEGFLSLIKHASIVCTNSFHAVAFSVIFNKPFIAGTNYPGSDSRISTLLEAANISDCEFSGTNKEYTVPKYDLVNEYIQKRSMECKEILVNALR